MNKRIDRFQKLSLVISMVLLAAWFIGVITAGEAAAQIRPAYTKNVDEPGRMPYEAWVEFYSSGCSFNCTNFSSYGGVLIFDAPAVPAGKRLVVQSVSAMLPGSDPYNSISLQSSRVISNQYVKWQYFGPFSRLNPATDIYGMTSAAFTTYGPGESPHIRVFLNNASNYIGNVTISGYLIDAAN